MSSEWQTSADEPKRPSRWHRGLAYFGLAEQPGEAGQDDQDVVTHEALLRLAREVRRNTEAIEELRAQLDRIERRL